KPTLVLISNLKGAALTGSSVTLTCTLTPQSTGWKFYWYKDGQYHKTEPDTHTYTISPVSESHRGRYKCYAGRGNPGYTTQYSNELQLEVTEKPKPELTSDLKGAALTGNPVRLTCTLKLQSAGWRFYWIKDTQSNETETETSHYFIRSVSVSDG
ncbi:carcinoembryonic antigen-related cell adhesion molecule 5-like, partial [Clarias magur]